MQLKLDHFSSRIRWRYLVNGKDISLADARKEYEEEHGVIEGRGDVIDFARGWRKARMSYAIDNLRSLLRYMTAPDIKKYEQEVWDLAHRINDEMGFHWDLSKDKTTEEQSETV